MATDAQLLESAKEALHKLVTGTQARVIVDQNGERVEYTAASADKLEAYIRKLEARISPTSAVPKPIRYVF